MLCDYKSLLSSSMYRSIITFIGGKSLSIVSQMDSTWSFTAQNHRLTASKKLNLILLPPINYP